jgi:hypothetical protein
VVHVVAVAQRLQFAVQTVVAHVGPPTVKNNPAVQAVQVDDRPAVQVAQPVTEHAAQVFVVARAVVPPKPGAQPPISQKPTLAHVRQLVAHAVHTFVVTPTRVVPTSVYPSIQAVQPLTVQAPEEYGTVVDATTTAETVCPHVAGQATQAPVEEM